MDGPFIERIKPSQAHLDLPQTIAQRIRDQSNGHHRSIRDRHSEELPRIFSHSIKLSTVYSELLQIAHDAASECGQAIESPKTLDCPCHWRKWKAQKSARVVGTEIYYGNNNETRRWPDCCSLQQCSILLLTASTDKQVKYTIECR